MPAPDGAAVSQPPERTPDGRYIIVRDRLWRASNPGLPDGERSRHVGELMAARRAVGDASRVGDVTAEQAARARVHDAKLARGERGPVWWDDGAPDYTCTSSRTRFTPESDRSRGGVTSSLNPRQRFAVITRQSSPWTGLPKYMGNGPRVIEVEVQNETHQSVCRLKTIALPRIGEGLRLQEPDGRWASYDVLDVWYQKAEYGDVWVPYLHVRMSDGELRAIDTEARNPMVDRSQAVPIEDFLKKFEGAEDHRVTPIKLDMSESVGA